MKICSLYGAGFYYVPGTDMCIKVGGWVRAETSWGANGSSVGTWTSPADVNNRTTNDWWWRARGYITADSRSQTAYGTVRGYIAVGLSGDNAAAFSSNRAFIQWAGFTFGIAQSFYDFYSSAAVAYHGFIPHEETGDGGAFVMAYTAQFGNGWSATISAEQPRSTQLINANFTTPFILSPTLGVIVSPTPVAAGGTTVAGAASGGAYGGQKAPDVVANVRVDQAWGSAQVMGAAHYINPSYYNPASGAAGWEVSGAPSTTWGWVVGAGLKLNAPMIGHGDYFQAEVNYTEGALKYLMAGVANGNYSMQNGTNLAYGVMSDGVFAGSVAAGTNTSVQLTTGWSVNASYEHFWNPSWRTSVYGGYMAVSYNTLANANLCNLQSFGNGVMGTGAIATAGCDNNWQMAWIGSRTQWNVTKDFYMGLDVAYAKLEGASTPTGFVGTNTRGANTNTARVLTAGSEDNWVARFRVHRDFYP